MATFTWSNGVNEIRDAIYNLISNAQIKNIENRKVTIYKRNLPSEPSKDDCPIIAIFKRNAAGNAVETDQPTLKLPRRVYVIIGFCDFSMADLDEAEVKTDDLIDQVINKLNTDPSLNGLVSGISVDNVNWDDANIRSIWFSVPSIELSMIGTKL